MAHGIVAAAESGVDHDRVVALRAVKFSARSSMAAEGVPVHALCPAPVAATIGQKPAADRERMAVLEHRVHRRQPRPPCLASAACRPEGVRH